MKYKYRLKRLVAFILTMAMLLVHACPQTIYAYNSENSIENEAVDDGIVLTTLVPNTVQDWAIAYSDGIGYPAFFHNRVQTDIKDSKNNAGIERDELKIPGAGRYGRDGRADITKKVDDFTYIWEVKPASNGYFPKKIEAVKQVSRYVNAKEIYRTGPNNVIKDSEFLTYVTAPNGRVTEYKVIYKNSLYNDGLIFYRFERQGTVKEGEQPETETVPAKTPIAVDKKMKLRTQ